ncbi:MAG: ABC transporter permease subunit, partial [Methylococcaceae bacterium]
MSNKLIKFFNITGLTWFVPFVKIAAGENPAQQIRQLWLIMGVPVIAFILFLGLWGFSASKVNTSLGAIPGPAAVWHEAGGLLAEHYAEKQKEDEYYQRQQERNKQRLAENPAAEIKTRPYNGQATYLDKIFTSLYTVFAGFVIATLIAVPLGLLCGMSPVFNTAINPLIQIFKPVSPLAWLPIVTLVVSAVYVTTENSWFEKSFLTSAITVTLCSLWPTLINTAVGVSSIDKDLVNVGKVLRLSWFTQIKKII